MNSNTLQGQTKKLIANIFSVCTELTKLTERPFTADGHLVGSMGETFGKFYYGITLYPPSYKGHDGSWRGRKVQIKATQRNSVDLKGETELLLVLKINPDGSFDEIYNGDGKRPWLSLAHRKQTKSGEINISFNSLRELNKEVMPSDRIPRIA